MYSESYSETTHTQIIALRKHVHTCTLEHEFKPKLRSVVCAKANFEEFML